MKSITTENGKKLRYMRRRNGISQSEMAQLLGTSRQRYSRIEADPDKHMTPAMYITVRDYVFRGGFLRVREETQGMTDIGNFD